jgi:hypothetical protein
MVPVGLEEVPEPTSELGPTRFTAVGRTEAGYKCTHLGGSIPGEGAEELFLAGEVEVDGPLGDAGPVGDFVEPGTGNAGFPEHFERGAEDLLGPFAGFAAPFWLSLGHATS